MGCRRRVLYPQRLRQQRGARDASGRGARACRHRVTEDALDRRGDSVQTSMDGSAWSKPVAEGKGEGGRTSIPFAPTRARFVRITQTDTAADAPNWSINNLRIYEAAAGK